MANFTISFNKTMLFEGGYANNPNDLGGETYRGISRKNFPSWNGWVIVDKYKQSIHSSKDLNATLKGNVQIQGLVSTFYRLNFWNPIMGDGLTYQTHADNIFDFAVNSGVGRAVRYAQRVVGTVEDGAMGNKTLTAINKMGASFVPAYKQARIDFVNKIVANNPSQKEFLTGWILRTENA